MTLPNLTDMTNEEIVVLIQNTEETFYRKQYLEFLYTKNSGLLYTAARSYAYNIPLDDKIQYAAEGFIQAVNKFDVNRDLKFVTYLGVVVNRWLYRYGVDDVKFIRIPEWASVKRIEFMEFVENYKQQHHKNPSVSFLSSHFGFSSDIVITLLQGEQQVPNVVKNDEESGGIDFFDVHNHDSQSHRLDENSFDLSIEEALDVCLDLLSPQDKLLLAAYYGLNGYEQHTLDQISRNYEDFEISTNLRSVDTVQRRIKKAVQSLKVAMREKNVSVKLEMFA